MKRFSLITCLILPAKQIGASRIDKRELEQQRRIRLRKRRLKGVFKLLQLYRAYSISFNSSNVAIFFWSWNLKDCIEVQEKKNKVFASLSPAPGRCLVPTFSTNREIRNFHVVVEKWRQRNVQKRSVMHVQSCCLANLNLLFFLSFALTSPSSLLKLPNDTTSGLDWTERLRLFLTGAHNRL